MPIFAYYMTTFVLFDWFDLKKPWTDAAGRRAATSGRGQATWTRVT